MLRPVFVSASKGGTIVMRRLTDPSVLDIFRRLASGSPLSFADARALMPGTASDRYAERDLFSREHAMKIWSFVLQHRLDLERIVVHCDAGVSRSPAVGAALARVFNGSDAELFGGRYRPNMRVYRMLLEANSTLPT
jgi:predicted protein tyrosine phosphatase